MGWCVENLKIPFGTKLNENNGNEYLDACENTGPKRTLKDYLKINYFIFCRFIQKVNKGVK
mgnify:CR=1 FL=1